jgi:hypothetical protein
VGGGSLVLFVLRIAIRCAGGKLAHAARARLILGVSTGAAFVESERSIAAPWLLAG